jgi:hypothetical protein
MKSDGLERLLRSAAKAPGAVPAEAPFGFDTRVIASWNSSAGLADEFAEITRFLRRAGAIGLTVLVLSGAIAYRQFRDEAALAAPLTNEYAIVDSAIQTEFGR